MTEIDETISRSSAKKFQDLIVWQKAHQWVLNVYTLTKTFPKEELFGLTSQLRRAAVSIPANIAEGFKRRTNVEKAKFYNIAQSSLEECRYYLILAQDLKICESNKPMQELESISKILDKYYSNVRQDTLSLNSEARSQKSEARTR